MATQMSITPNIGQYKNFVAPTSERTLGFNAYADGLSIDVCTTADMRKGWLAAWRAEGYAITSQVWGEESTVTA